LLVAVFSQPFSDQPPYRKIMDTAHHDRVERAASNIPLTFTLLIVGMLSEDVTRRDRPPHRHQMTKQVSLGAFLFGLSDQAKE